MNRRSAALFSSCAWIVSAVGVMSSAVAQCALSAVPSGGVPGVDGTVYATAMHDPDGPGPATPQLVFGGQFAVVGAQCIDDLAAWDPATGAVTALGGSNGELRALLSLGNGLLIAAGTFSSIGGVAADNIAQWNGSAWSPLGAGCNAEVRALAVLPNGDLVAGGAFSAAGGVAAGGVARWNGASWSSLGAGIGVGVNALAVLPGGDVVAAGESVFAGGVQGCPVARWNGVAWLPLGGPLQSGAGARVAALVAMPNGDVIAGGSFHSAGSGISYLARWSAATNAWSASGGGNTVHALRLVGGVVLVGQAWQGSLGRISYLIGSSVSQLSVTNRLALAFDVLPNGDLIAAGSFTYVDGNGGALGTPATGLARADAGGIGWGPVIAMPGQARLQAVAADGNGGVYAAGDFDLGGAPFPVRSTVAQWTGSAWAPFAALSGPVVCMTRASNGDVVAGIQTTPPFGGPPIQRWNGSSWSAVPSIPGSVPGGATPSALAVLPNGDLVASFDDQVRRFDGSSQWLPMGSPLGQVRSFVSLSNGDLVGAAGGVAGGVAPGVHRWDGSTWLPLGGPTNAPIHALLRLPDGDLVAGGAFSMIGGVSAARVARWNGTSWSPLGAGVNGTVLALASAPNGDVLVGGEFSLAGGSPAPRWARWNGSSWSPMPAVNGRVTSLAIDATGTLFSTGDFSVVSSQLATSWSRLVTTCPATVAVAGAGCVGSGGANVLSATTLPWLGATFVATATGLPSNGLAIRVYGFAAAATPLVTILPQSVTGCLLLASPDWIDAHPTGLGTLTTTTPLPNTVALANGVLRQQIVALATDALGSIVSATSTNALVLTLGAF